MAIECDIRKLWIWYGVGAREEMRFIHQPQFLPKTPIPIAIFTPWAASPGVSTPAVRPPAVALTTAPSSSPLSQIAVAAPAAAAAHRANRTDGHRDPNRDRVVIGLTDR